MNKFQNILVEYVKEKGRRGRPIGCVVAVCRYIEGKPTIAIGWSKCMIKPSGKPDAPSEPDTFSRSYALNKALGRANSNHGLSNQNGDGYITVQQAWNTEPHTLTYALMHVHVSSSIRPAIRKMANRAVKYFQQAKL